MKVILTSSPCIEHGGPLNENNGFVDLLRNIIPAGTNIAYIASFEDTYDITDDYGNCIKNAIKDAGIDFKDFTIVDGRNLDNAENIVKNASTVILAGGHVPTQNRLFVKMGLKDILKDHDGIVIGISAGSMNLATEVYAQPELEGEAIDPEYPRFIEGLGLTDLNIIPHYNEIADFTLDGLKLFEDIALKDSIDHEFYVLNDGSYIVIDGDEKTLYGESQLIKDGVMMHLISDGEFISLI